MEAFDDDIGPSVVLASPGMMQSGLSRELFEKWCTNKRNGVILAGYAVEGKFALLKNHINIRQRNTCASDQNRTRRDRNYVRPETAFKNASRVHVFFGACGLQTNIW